MAGVAEMLGKACLSGEQAIIHIRPSDLYHKYRRKKEHRGAPKFCGLPDPSTFDRDDLYEVIPMFEAVMAALGSRDGQVLLRMEEVLIYEMPKFLETREEVYNCLLAVMRDVLDGC